MRGEAAQDPGRRLRRLSTLWRMGRDRGLNSHVQPRSSQAPRHRNVLTGISPIEAQPDRPRDQRLPRLESRICRAPRHSPKILLRGNSTLLRRGIRAPSESRKPNEGCGTLGRDDLPPAPLEKNGQKEKRGFDHCGQGGHAPVSTSCCRASVSCWQSRQLRPGSAYRTWQPGSALCFRGSASSPPAPSRRVSRREVGVACLREAESPPVQK